ncbi:hypothetical protein J6590_041179 [Homalodisca vitripennis]|nr:hypothetical protein J6590_041179 [Homalodisca vitripennis]
MSLCFGEEDEDNILEYATVQGISACSSADLQKVLLPLGVHDKYSTVILQEACHLHSSIT